MEPKLLPDKLNQLLPRGGIAALTDGIEFLSLWRWVRLSLLVGGVVGLASAGAYYVLEAGEALLLHRLGGLTEPQFGASEHLISHGHHPRVWWILMILPALGGLGAGLVTWRLAPEASGSGVDELIDAYHNDRGYIRPRVPLIKLFASLFTLGSGGSAGREGPMAQIGAGFGSYLGQVLGLTPRERRLLLLAGAASGISALFRAPLGASLWALEVLYRDDFESEGMFPCLVSSVTAYSVFTLLLPQGALFTVPVSYDFHPEQLVFYAALGLTCAPMGLLWVKIIYFQYDLWGRMRLPQWAKPALGGLLMGALCVGVPWVFSTGYGWMQDALRPIDDPARQLPVGYAGFGLLLGLAVAKMLATSLTVCSGGSGGKFAPTLFIGGFVGGAMGLLFHQIAPGVVTQPGAFVLVGMGTFYAALARVPIATIILISEMFSSYDLLVPLMFTEMIALLLLRRYTMYPMQVSTAIESPAHMAEFTVDVLQDLHVRDHYTRGRASATIPTSMSLRDFLQHVSSTADSFFVVRDQAGELAGIVSLSNVRSVVTEQEFLDVVLVTDAMWPLVTLAPDTDLRVALGTFLESRYDHLPVVDPAHPNEVLGMLSQQQIFGAYNAEIVRRRLGAEGGEHLTGDGHGGDEDGDLDGDARGPGDGVGHGAPNGGAGPGA